MARFAECDDYVNSIQVPQLIKTQKLQGGYPEMNGIRPIMFTGGYCVVFPYIANKKYAVRCWHASLNGAQERTSIISEYLSKINLPYFVDFQYYDEGIATPKGVMPIVVMDWVDAKPLKRYIEDNLHKPGTLSCLAESFIQMAEDLHANSISHGDLQHGNIMVRSNGDIVLVDYDSMYVPELDGYPNEIYGLDGYQHPLRKTEKQVSPKADYFSELVIYTSLKAIEKFPELWEELEIRDTDTLVFSKEDLYSKGKTEIYKRLSADPYLSELVEDMIRFLNYSSIESLEPIETIEPNRKRTFAKKRYASTIEQLIEDIDDDAFVSPIKEWIRNIDNYSLEEVQSKCDSINQLVKSYKEQKRREESVQELSEQWNRESGNSASTTVIDTAADVESMRDDWSSPTQPNHLEPAYRKEEVDQTRKEWN